MSPPDQVLCLSWGEPCAAPDDGAQPQLLIGVVESTEGGCETGLRNSGVRNWKAINF